MRWPSVCLVLILALPVYAADDVVYDSTTDGLKDQSDVRVQLHQRAEGEERPPLVIPEHELMTQPCMGWHFQAGTVLYNAETSRELMLLTSAAETGGAVLVLVSLEDKACLSLPIPGTAGGWALAPMRGDRVAIGTYYDGDIHIYSLPDNKFTAAVDIPGESYIWNLVEGADGRLYGGTYPGGKLFALDQDTLALEDCGQAFSPNRFLHEVSPLPDGRMLCRAGTEQPGLRLYDPASKSFTEAPASFSGISGGTLWEGYFVAGDKVFDGSLQPVTPPPFPVPDPALGEWSVITSVTTRHTLYLRQGNAVYRYGAGDTALNLVYNFDLRGAQLMGACVHGGVAGVRGQQYFRIRPGDTAVARQEFSIPSPPRVPVFLRADDAGQIWGAPEWGQTLFFMDGKTGVFVSMGSVTARPGGVQDIAFVDSVAYGVSHPGGAIFRLDIQAPWNEWDRKNPHVLEYLEQKGYQKATGGIVASAAGKLYSGWSAATGTYGGAIAVTDPVSGRTSLFQNPAGTQAIAGLALNGEYLFAGTSVEADGLPPKPDAKPQFAVLGLDTVQPYWSRGFEGKKTVNRLLYNGAAECVAMAVDNVLYFFDIKAMAVRGPLESAPPEITSTGIAHRNDAYVYYGHGSEIIRVNLKTGAWEQVLELPGEAGALTAGSNGSLYAVCGVNIYQVAFPASYPDIASPPVQEEKPQQ